MVPPTPGGPFGGPQMTRKHFKALAAELRQARRVLFNTLDPSYDITSVHQGFNMALAAVEDVCQRQNNHFDREKFRAAIDEG